MSRLRTRFESLQKEGRKALIPYITAGDPAPEQTVQLMHMLVESGANILELGVPFSDPMADGPVIQAACERALKHRTNLKQVLELVRGFRQQDSTTPVVLMGYLNPVEIMGYKEFASAAYDAGVDGVLTVDLPPEEAELLIDALRSVAIDPVFLIAPTSTDARIEMICQQASGFVYYVSLKGVTGAANLDISAVQDKLATIRRHTMLPIGVGFGIHDAETAGQVARIADAVVVGSPLVKCIAATPNDSEQIHLSIGALLRSMRQAMDANTRQQQGQQRANA